MLSLIINTQAFANDITIVGDAEQTIQLTHLNNTLDSQVNSKSITLPTFQLSSHAQHVIYQHIQQALEHSTDNHTSSVTSAKSKSVQLGMNHVPVLDQGRHGTCVTFAITATIDAALDKGNYISQLCLLQLGQNLENQGLGRSGWTGLWGNVELERIDKFGIISLKNQHQNGCGGLNDYPYYTTPNTEMSAEEYESLSQHLSGKRFTWKPIFTKKQSTTPTKDINKKVTDVKAALDAGNRVTFGVLLPRTDLGTLGAVAWHHYFADTWVLSYKIAQELEYASTFPGHEMIITGYDDNAVAMDDYGHRHYGLFTLRNSWGSYVADWGDFYMSYDYFNALATEAYQIQPLK